jgi:hypothetical protein
MGTISRTGAPRVVTIQEWLARFPSLWPYISGTPRCRILGSTARGKGLDGGRHESQVSLAGLYHWVDARGSVFRAKSDNLP